jgi:hypothetical protein
MEGLQNAMAEREVGEGQWVNREDLQLGIRIHQ